MNFNYQCYNVPALEQPGDSDLISLHLKDRAMDLGL